MTNLSKFAMDLIWNLLNDQLFKIWRRFQKRIQACCNIQDGAQTVNYCHKAPHLGCSSSQFCLIKIEVERY